MGFKFMFDVRTELFCRGKFGCAISTWRKFVIGYSNSAVPSGLEVPVQWSREYHSSSWSKFCFLSNLRLTNIVLFRFPSLFFSVSVSLVFDTFKYCYLPRQETSLPITVNHCRSLNKLSSSSSSKRAIIFKSMRKPRLSLYPIIPLLPFLHLFKQWPISGYTQIIFVGIYWFY